MGIRIPNDPESYEFGNNCNHCTPGLFPDGHTPKKIRMIYYDVQACPGHPDPPNNYWFEGIQDNVNPCLWIAERTICGLDWMSRWDAQFGVLHLSNLIPPLTRHHFIGGPQPCNPYFSVNVATCFDKFGFGGRAVVRWEPDTMLASLCNDYHMVPRQEARYERDEVGIFHTQIRLASRKFSSNVLIYIDTQDFVFIDMNP